MTTRAVFKTVVECLVSVMAGAASLTLGYGDTASLTLGYGGAASMAAHADADGCIARFHFEQAIVTGVATITNAMHPVGEKGRWKRPG